MRQRAYLRQRYRALLAYIGEVLALVGALYLVPLVLLLPYPQEVHYAPGFLLAGVPLIVVGLYLWKRLAPNEQHSVNVQEAYVIVSVVWVAAIIWGTLPFLVNNDLSFLQAIFETTSGWTTTGLTVINVDEAPRLLLFHRSFIQWAGGAGFAIIAVSAIGVMFGGGLSVAEGRTDQLAPHVRNSARIVLQLYISYAVFGILALRLAGMDWFDSVNHAFTALATGGFSTRSTSIGYYDSAAIEAVIIILMILGTINFIIPYLLLQRRYRLVARNGEFRFMAVIWISAILLLFSFVTIGAYTSAERAVRVAAFEVTTALTGAGFSLVEYHTWPDFGWMILIILMLMGGGSGSTSGGIKQFRNYLLYKAVIWEIKRAFMPRHMVNEPAIWHGERRHLLDDREVRQVALFVALYVSVFLLGSGIFSAYGFSMKESMFEFASTLGTVGLSVGITSPDLPGPLLAFQSLAMLLGRLEFFALIIGVLKVGADARVILSKAD